MSVMPQPDEEKEEKQPNTLGRSVSEIFHIPDRSLDGSPCGMVNTPETGIIDIDVQDLRIELLRRRARSR